MVLFEDRGVVPPQCLLDLEDLFPRNSRVSVLGIDLEVTARVEDRHRQNAGREKELEKQCPAPIHPSQRESSCESRKKRAHAHSLTPRNLGWLLWKIPSTRSASRNDRIFLNHRHEVSVNILSCTPTANEDSLFWKC